MIIPVDNFATMPFRELSRGQVVRGARGVSSLSGAKFREIEKSRDSFEDHGRSRDLPNDTEAPSLSFL